MKAKSFLLLNLGFLFVTGCTDINNPYPYGGYNYPTNTYPSGGYYGGGYDYDRRNRWEERRLDDERRRLDDERRRLEERRRNQHYPPRWQPPRAPHPQAQPRPQTPRQPDRCPPGFSPSERKCTPQERSRGCRDIRTPSGLGCVSR